MTVSDIRMKGLKAVISNLERNLEWIEEQGMLKGFEQGIEKGNERGIGKGIEEGIEKGIEKGIELEKREIAAKMLREGLDATLITRITGLSMDEIALLKNKQK
jgi:predicted transposase/invertase (TIGR01784 family)